MFPSLISSQTLNSMTADTIASTQIYLWNNLCHPRGPEEDLNIHVGTTKRVNITKTFVVTKTKGLYSTKSFMGKIEIYRYTTDINVQHGNGEEC